MAPSFSRQVKVSSAHLFANARFRSPYGPFHEIIDNALRVAILLHGQQHRLEDVVRSHINVVTRTGAARTIVVQDASGGLPYREVAARLGVYGDAPAADRAGTVSQYGSGSKLACLSAIPEAMVFLAKHRTEATVSTSAVVSYVSNRNDQRQFNVKSYDLESNKQGLLHDLRTVRRAPGDLSSLQDIIERELGRLRGLVAGVDGSGGFSVIFYRIGCSALEFEADGDVVSNLRHDGEPYASSLRSSIAHLYGDYDEAILRNARGGIHFNGEPVVPRSLEDLFVHSDFLPSVPSPDPSFRIACGAVHPVSEFRRPPFRMAAGKVLVSVMGRVIASIDAPPGCTRLKPGHAVFVSIRRLVETSRTKDGLDPSTHGLVSRLLLQVFGEGRAAAAPSASPSAAPSAAAAAAAAAPAGPRPLPGPPRPCGPIRMREIAQSAPTRGAAGTLPKAPAAPAAAPVPVAPLPLAPPLPSASSLITQLPRAPALPALPARPPVLLPKAPALSKAPPLFRAPGADPSAPSKPSPAPSAPAPAPSEPTPSSSSSSPSPSPPSSASGSQGVGRIFLARRDPASGLRVWCTSDFGHADALDEQPLENEASEKRRKEVIKRRCIGLFEAAYHRAGLTPEDRAKFNVENATRRFTKLTQGGSLNTLALDRLGNEETRRRIRETILGKHATDASFVEAVEKVAALDGVWDWLVSYSEEPCKMRTGAGAASGCKRRAGGDAEPDPKRARTSDGA